ncbi:MAG: uroporphyrinogen decarboxylase [Acidobacteriota bacterium]
MSTTDGAQPAPAAEPASLFLRACRRLPVERTPIWLMRQAGRYMPEYRAIRERHGILDIIRTPELAAEVTMQPVRAFEFDAAIIFADILPPLVGMGLDLEFSEGGGPRIGNPIAEPRDVDRLGTPPAEETMPHTLTAIRMAVGELETSGTPLIGFAGAPFTLACYAVEGGTSKSFTKVKALMYGEPSAWKRLMTKLVTVQVDYLRAQADAGAEALQVFDSWAGIALGLEDYRRFVRPYNALLFARLQDAGVPVIHFSMGTSFYIEEIASEGGDVMSVDWRRPIDEAWKAIGYERPIQGNLDPAALLAPWRELNHQINGVLDRVAGRPGHIFNLGHGILPNTPVDNVRRLVESVRVRPAVPR